MVLPDVVNGDNPSLVYQREPGLGIQTTDVHDVTVQAGRQTGLGCGLELVSQDQFAFQADSPFRQVAFYLVPEFAVSIDPVGEVDFLAAVNGAEIFAENPQGRKFAAVAAGGFPAATAGGSGIRTAAVSAAAHKAAGRHGRAEQTDEDFFCFHKITSLNVE